MLKIVFEPLDVPHAFGMGDSFQLALSLWLFDGFQLSDLFSSLELQWFGAIKWLVDATFTGLNDQLK